MERYEEYVDEAFGEPMFGQRLEYYQHLDKIKAIRALIASLQKEVSTQKFKAAAEALCCLRQVLRQAGIESEVLREFTDPARIAARIAITLSMGTQALVLGSLVGALPGSLALSGVGLPVRVTPPR